MGELLQAHGCETEHSRLYMKCLSISNFLAMKLTTQHDLYYQLFKNRVVNFMARKLLD